MEPLKSQVLRAQEVHISRKLVANLMAEMGIRGTCSKKKFKTTNRDKSKTLSPDLIKRSFNASYPDEKYVSDLTYIPTKEGWLYLVTILDIYSRRILGWSIDITMTTEMLIKALDQLKAVREHTSFVRTIFHSDHKSQYTSTLFRSNLGLINPWHRLEIHTIMRWQKAFGHCLKESLTLTHMKVAKKQELKYLNGLIDTTTNEYILR
jgi:putative transposase